MQVTTQTTPTRGGRGDDGTATKLLIVQNSSSSPSSPLAAGFTEALDVAGESEGFAARRFGSQDRFPGLADEPLATAAAICERPVVGDVPGDAAGELEPTEGASSAFGWIGVSRWPVASSPNDGRSLMADWNSSPPDVIVPVCVFSLAASGLLSSRRRRTQPSATTTMVSTHARSAQTGTTTDARMTISSSLSSSLDDEIRLG